MKLKYQMAIKFFSESKNEEQLDISYIEVEKFLTNFNQYKSFYKFETFTIDIKIINRLPKETT